jgi:hypothetical protein
MIEINPCLEDLGTVEESAAQPPQEMFLET